MKEVSEIRRVNYHELKKRFMEREAAEGRPKVGVIQRLAEQAGIAAAYLSHINTDRRPIGGTVARKLEAVMGLPVGWMDTEHLYGTNAEDARAHQFRDMAMELYGRDPEGVRDALMQYMMAQIPKRET